MARLARLASNRFWVKTQPLDCSKPWFADWASKKQPSFVPTMIQTPKNASLWRVLLGGALQRNQKEPLRQFGGNPIPFFDYPKVSLKQPLGCSICQNVSCNGKRSATRSFSREVRIRVPFVSSVVYFSRETLPKKEAVKGRERDLGYNPLKSPPLISRTQPEIGSANIQVNDRDLFYVGVVWLSCPVASKKKMASFFGCLTSKGNPPKNTNKKEKTKKMEKTRENRAPLGNWVGDLTPQLRGTFRLEEFSASSFFSSTWRFLEGGGQVFLEATPFFRWPKEFGETKR